jgi:hypothetical protein
MATDVPTSSKRMALVYVRGKERVTSVPSKSAQGRSYEISRPPASPDMAGTERYDMSWLRQDRMWVFGESADAVHIAGDEA